MTILLKTDDLLENGDCVMKIMSAGTHSESYPYSIEVKTYTQ